jgi:hypothetical protein
MHRQSTNKDSFKFAHDSYDVLPKDSGPVLERFLQNVLARLLLFQGKG